ncbi:phospholipase A2 inhibitor and Ly6/PLAUR domain-containing protein-like [Bombina bombina]|uniref:phospholipase A2 inhibitor and Ly6/PLAUR domain-containing protein-like n=1 Tax=Bombina bombina TaxID=8345 RepID=UPI00235AA966|nr:phospholipase A2 inhibitor and Ly6/PLAUR domain-containing protein-like [Bombina bombina]
MACVFYFVTLSLVLFKGNCLSCIQCNSFNDTPCIGNSQTCSSSNDVCASTLIHQTGDMWHSSFFIRYCANVKECDKSGIVSNLYTTTLSSTKCCNFDNCSPPAPSLPSQNNTENELICPSYFDAKLEACDIKNYTKCTGDQNRCIRYSTTTTLASSKSSLYVGGCSTESLCLISNSYISAPRLTLEVKRSCSNKASALSYTLGNIYLSALFCINSLFLHYYLML